ncbi:MAG: hypothetical protein WBQ37_04330, partial [Candidatus Competibacter sp.]
AQARAGAIRDGDPDPDSRDALRSAPARRREFAGSDSGSGRTDGVGQARRIQACGNASQAN